MSENKEILDIYLRIRNQHIMGFSGPIDLDFSSLKFIMDLMEVKDKKKTFERVHKLYRTMLLGIYEESKLKRLDGIR